MTLKVKVKSAPKIHQSHQSTMKCRGKLQDLREHLLILYNTYNNLLGVYFDLLNEGDPKMDELTKEASYILLQRVKVALAIIVIMDKPSDVTAKEYAMTIQSRYTDKSIRERRNLIVSKENLYEQMISLLPNNILPTLPMKTELMETEETHETQSQLDEWPSSNSEFLNNTETDETFSKESIISKLKNMQELFNDDVSFVQGILKLKQLCNEKNVNKNEFLDVVCKLNPNKTSNSFPYLTPTDSGYVTDDRELKEISGEVFRYLAHATEAEEILLNVVKSLLEKIKHYLNDPILVKEFATNWENSVLQEAVETIHMSIKSNEGYTRLSKICLNLVKDSYDQIFTNTELGRHDYLKHLNRILIYFTSDNKSLCEGTLTVLKNLFEKLVEILDSKNNTEISNSIENSFYLFYSLRALLKVYFEKFYKQDNNSEERTATNFMKLWKDYEEKLNIERGIIKELIVILQAVSKKTTDKNLFVKVATQECVNLLMERGKY